MPKTKRKDLVGRVLGGVGKPAEELGLVKDVGRLEKAGEELGVPAGAKRGEEFREVAPAELLGKLLTGLVDQGSMDNLRRLLTYLLDPAVWVTQPEKIQTMALRLSARLVEVAAGSTVRLTGADDPGTNEELKELERNLLAKLTGSRATHPPAGNRLKPN